MAQLTSTYCYITSTATKTALMTLLSLLVFVSALPVGKRQAGTQDLEAFSKVRGGMDVMDYMLGAGSTQVSVSDLVLFHLCCFSMHRCLVSVKLLKIATFCSLGHFHYSFHGSIIVKQTFLILNPALPSPAPICLLFQWA